MERITEEWGPGIPTCEKCHRVSVTVDDQDRLLCARHAIIFMTGERLRDRTEPVKKSA